MEPYEVEFAVKDASPVLYDFMMDDTFVRGIKGPVGSGKSSGCAIEAMRRSAQQQPQADGIRHSRGAIIRNTYRELEDTTLNTFMEWFPEKECGKFNIRDFTYHFRVGNVHADILFRALDRPGDVGKLLSLELTWAWANEAREIPLPVIEMLQTRVGRYPSPRGVRPTWFGLWMDTNPPDDDHWWYQLAEVKKPKFHKFWAQPSGRSKSAENIANLPDLYYERMASGKSEEWAGIYVDGQYGFVQEGKVVYPEYRDSIHCREFEMWPNSVVPQVDVGLDFGLTPAAVFHQRSGMGQVRVFDELVMERGGAKQLAEALKPMLAKYKGYDFRFTGDPSGGAGSSIDAEENVFKILRANGIPAQPCNPMNNNPDVRREAGRAPMMRMVDGEPGLLLHPRCVKLRKSLGAKFCYRRLQVAGDPKYKQTVDKDEWSHVAEAYEYGNLGGGENPKVNTNMKPPKPAVMAQDWNPYD